MAYTMLYSFFQSSSLFAGLVLFSGFALAASSHPAGNNLSYGASTQGQTLLSNSANPASGAFDISRQSQKNIIGNVAFGAGVEYGNLDNFFERLDELSQSLTGEGQAGEPGGGGNSIGDNFDITDPDLDQLIDEISNAAIRLTGLIGLIASQGYAKADARAQFSLIFPKEVLAGVISLRASQQISSGAVGIAEPMDFNAEQALAELENVFNLSPTDPPGEFDLSAGVLIRVNPPAGEISVGFNNDSLLLTKAAKISELGLSYSRTLAASETAKLYWGLTTKYTQVGLSNIAIRVGDLTDSEALFDDIKNASLKTQSAFGLDAGVLWVDKTFSLGASVHNLSEPSFKFPLIDTSQIGSLAVVNQLGQSRIYTLGRQFKVEGSLFSQDRRWSLNTAVDLNPIEEPLGSEVQWASISAGLNRENRIFSNIRAGIHRNMAGSELSYGALGVSLFKFIEFDLTSTLNNTKIDGKELPRGFSFSLGCNFQF